MGAVTFWVLVAVGVAFILTALFMVALVVIVQTRRIRRGAADTDITLEPAQTPLSETPDTR
ncbi:MAG: hypothetical protein LBJ43_06055 [Propionibacteriaceae bacterium]|nr:hypothetical protein [Propionibacteriaceae bacterium]